MIATIIGIDPGEMTGVFLLQVLRTRPELQLSYGAAQVDRTTIADYLERLISAQEPDVVAVERYFVTQRTTRVTRQPAAQEVIGIARELCRKYGSKLALQAKSDAVKLGSDTKLRALGWYGTESDHANDAARQALLALSGSHPRVFQLLVTSGKLVA